MALDLGWKLNEEIEGAWKDDAAFIGLTPQALADWERDGRIVHLRPFENNGKATIIKWRPLNSDEAAHAERYKFLSSRSRLMWECFALAVRIPGMAEEGMSSNGKRVHTMTVDTAGNVRLSTPTMNNLHAKYPDLIDFFGQKIHDATWPTEAEKKASSPPSTPPPSSGEVGTPVSTVVQGATESAA